MADLTTDYLGLHLRSPLVASASPLSGDLDGIRRLEEAGAAAVVLPSLFEEQILHESLDIDRFLAGGEAFAEAMGLFPELQDYNTGPERYLHLIEQAKHMMSVPLIASLNGTSIGGWIRYARLMQDAGADALELNVYFVAADPDRTGEQVEARYVELVGAVREAIEIPLAVKIGPFFTSTANVARLLVEAGADGLVLFNRFYQPDIDLERMEVAPRLVLSSSEESRLVVRWMAILRGRTSASLAATTGIHEVEDVVKVILAGADVAMLASVLIKRGPEYLAVLESGLSTWLADHGYRSVSQMKGSMSKKAVADPSAFERANYMRTLTSFSNSFRA